MKQKPVYNKIEFDSIEEIEFYQWCEEAQSAGLILTFEYHPESFLLSDTKSLLLPKELKTKIGYHKKPLCRSVSYEPDFLIGFGDSDCKLSELFIKKFGFVIIIYTSPNGEKIAYIDVKGLPAFRRGQMPNNSSATFSIKQAWVYEKYGIYINKIIARDMKSNGEITKAGFFAKTWVPERIAFCKNRKTLTRTKAFENCKLLKEIL